MKLHKDLLLTYFVSKLLLNAHGLFYVDSNIILLFLLDIGRLLENLLEKGNFKVLNIGRTTDKNYQIGKKIDTSLFDNIDIVFYLAWEFNTRLKNYNSMNIESYNNVVNISKKKNCHVRWRKRNASQSLSWSFGINNVSLCNEFHTLCKLLHHRWY